MDGRVSKAVGSWRALAAEHRGLCVAGALYLSWTLSMVLTGLPFPSGEHVIGNAFDLAASAGFVVSIFLARAFAFRGALTHPSRLKRWMLAAGALGIASCGLIACGPHLGTVLASESTRFAWVGIEGALLGASLAFSFLALSPLFFLTDRKRFFALCALELAGASLVLLAVSWLVRPPLQAYAWALVLASSYAAYRRGLAKEKAGLNRCTDDAKSFVLPQAPPLDFPWPHALVVAFSVLNGFFLGFVIGNFPVNFHLPVFADAFEHRGMASGVVLGLCDLSTFLTLLFTVVLLATIGGCLKEREFKLAPYALIALVLIAAACVTIPLYSSTTPPIVALVPIAVAGIILGLQLRYIELVQSENSAGILQKGLDAVALCGVGYVAAAALSLLHILFPVGGSDPRQIFIFGLLIALVIADVYLCIMLHRALRWTFFPAGFFKAPLDDSNLRGRCRSAAEAYKLTPRETEILELLAEGRGGPYIQDQLSISRNTFKTHVQHIYQKTGVASKEELLDLLRS